MAIVTTTPGLHDFTDDNFLLPNRRIKVDSDDLRNGQQCKYATRFTTMEMLTVVSAMDKVGFESMEIWGGATFDAAMRYCNDDPWERLRLLKALMVRTPARMLLRGRNLVGYHPYPDDIIRKFIELAVKNGIDIFGVFDGLNDTRNCEVAIDSIKKAGKQCRGILTYTVSPMHSTEKYIDIAKEYVHLGCDAITVGDMAGQMSPPAAFELIKALKDSLDIPVIMSGCCTGGMAEMTYWEAIRAGADIVTTCFASLAGGSSWPAVESISAALLGSPADTGFNLEQLTAVDDKFKVICKNHEDVKSTFANCNPDVLRHQTPGGMLSNLEYQLRVMNAYDKLDEVLKEIEVVRRDMGYPPLATPFSQMVGAQATTNVLQGKRYATLSKEIKAYVAGEYGKTPGPISEELKNAAINISLSNPVAETICWEKAVEDSKSFSVCEEDSMSYALFPELAEPFLRKKNGIEK